jgi:hypothetical protein
MIGFLTMDNSARQPADPSDECASLENLYRMPEGKIRKDKFRLRRSVLSRAGRLMRVDIAIHLAAGQRMKPRELEEIVRECCSEYFEYAVSTSHSKTVLCELNGREGRLVGDLTATFLPALQ